MDRERIQILQMLQEGRITVDEATRLLEAMDLPVDLPSPTFRQTLARQTPMPAIAIRPEPQAVIAQASPPSLGSQAFKLILGVNLEGALLNGANFDGAKFFFSNADSANLQNADFSGAWIVGTNLDKANFEGADVRGAVLLGANFDGADFRNADLRDTVFMGANFDSANFRDADLQGRKFIGVNMDGHQHRATSVEIVPGR